MSGDRRSGPSGGLVRRYRVVARRDEDGSLWRARLEDPNGFEVCHTDAESLGVLEGWARAAVADVVGTDRMETATVAIEVELPDAAEEDGVAIVMSSRVADQHLPGQAAHDAGHVDGVGAQPAAEDDR